MLTQPSIIQVDHWQADDDSGLAYPEGARPKRLLISPLTPEWSAIKPNWKYLFKQSDERYPQQLWCEVIAYHIGTMMEIPVPPAYIGYSQKSNQCAALIEWFYQEGETLFISAGSLFHKMIPGFDREKGCQHNFKDAKEICQKMVGYHWREGIADMLVLDTLIGNTDRHQENWGFLINYRDLSTQVHRFAPWFDNGTSLGCERFPKDVASWNDARLTTYIAKGLHHFRPTRESNQRLPQLDFFSSMVKQNDFKELIRQRFSKFNLEKFGDTLETLGNLPLSVALDEPRRRWIYRIIAYRARKMEEILQ